MKQRSRKPASPVQTHVLGFTLIELMIAIAIVAILAAVAMPSFIEQIQKTRRTNAKGALLELTNREELYFSNCNTYTTALTRPSGCCTVGACGLGLSTTLSPDGGFYTLSVAAGAAGISTSFTSTATRVDTKGQADDKCGNFTLTETGVKGVVNNASGWGADRCW
jgi:type IV pilus assembly protein PilE